jgi:NAD(P)-dependent dehydrogenase (short-subunit alcohol dehydrogenase family)
MRFEGTTVAILGGNSGIGRSAAIGFAAEGARLAITGRDPGTLEKVAAETGALSIRCDIASIADNKAAFAQIGEKLGPIDVLFVNAGIGGFAPVAEVSPELWDQLHGVNLRGCFFACQAALPHLRDGGSIVVTGSIGSVLALPGNAAYASAKAGLRAVVRILAIELVPRRIRVNMVSPGPTETPLINRNPGMSTDAVDHLRQQMIAAVPMHRMGEPEEVARAVLFLASSEASFITGVDLFVDGGCVEL